MLLDAQILLIIEHVTKLICDPLAPDLHDVLLDCKPMRDLHETLLLLRENLSRLSRGELSQAIALRGYLGGAFKALTANLRHLAWQVQQVEKGDFTQRVEFLGEFSSSFNNMVIQLDTTLTALRQREESLITLTSALREEVALRTAALQALSKSEANFRHLAEHDPLTDLLNRRSVLARVQEEIQRAVQFAAPCCLALLDVDFFKRFNDTYGHIAGDEALRHIVRMAVSCLRQADFAGRYGGEEFLFFFSNADLKQGVRAAERICKAVESSPVVIEDKRIRVTVSIGVHAIWPTTPGERTEHFLQSALNTADKALYQAKKLGRNTVVAAEEPTP